MALFRDIPQFTRSASYMVHVGLDYLASHYAHYVLHYGLDVSPDFQRGNVWTQQQKVRFVEYMLRGGTSGLDIYINCPTWQHSTEVENDSCVLVDGKQRLDAALGFINNEFPVFGSFYRDFTDRLRSVNCCFRWHVNDLKTREEVLSWYLDLNSGGTVHTEEELTKVRGLIETKAPYVRPSDAERHAEARVDREVIQNALRDEAEQEAKRIEASKLRDAEEAAKPKKGRVKK